MLSGIAFLSENLLVWWILTATGTEIQKAECEVGNDEDASHCCLLWRRGNRQCLAQFQPKLGLASMMSHIVQNLDLIQPIRAF
jgi:hypothetical protein